MMISDDITVTYGIWSNNRYKHLHKVNRIENITYSSSDIQERKVGTVCGITLVFVSSFFRRYLSPKY